MKGIEPLKGKYKDSTIWVIGSGSTLDYVPPDFFNDKITVGVNRVYKKYPVTYSATMHHFSIDDMLKANQTVITTEFECGFPDRGALDIKYADKDVYMAKHQKQDIMIPHYDWFDQDDALIVGGTSSILAMSFAVHLGAKYLMLCGMDGASLNGRTHFDGYNEKNYDHTQLTACRRDYNWLIRHFRDFLKDEDVYCYTLNPFIGLLNELQTIE